MKPVRLVWQIYRYFMIIALACLAVMSIYLTVAIKRVYIEQVIEDLQIRAALVTEALTTGDSLVSPEVAAQVCQRLGKLSGTRYTVILPDGRVIGDSRKDARRMENHRYRPEVISALRGDCGNSVRFSHTLRRNLVYVAIPVKKNSRIVAIVRAALPVDTVAITLRVIRTHIMAALVLAVILFAFLGIFISRLITRPLDNVRKAAEQMAAGNLDSRATVEGSREITTLAQTLNNLAHDLQSRLQTIKGQEQELRTVFAGMHEGVLALDSEMRIIHINAGARRWLEISSNDCKGKPLQKAMRHADFIRLAKEVSQKEKPSEQEFAIRYGDGTERWFIISSARIAYPKPYGTVIVMNNITRIKRLDIMRKDFVADVSHELKTPLTAICGVAETLMEDPCWENAPSKRFIDMLQRHATRMQTLVEDLLTLASIEYDSERGAVDLDPMPVAEIIERAVSISRDTAQQRGITISTATNRQITAAVNPPMLEQAIGNLLDNAIKYCPAGSEIHITLFTNDHFCEITVADNGPGIDPQHLPHLFQRFYRVDKARSRSLGGTGLGLAIVKHIALAHNGRVMVQSTPGQGSTFTIRFPVAGSRTLGVAPE